jgi:hypothetical protein
MSRAIHRLTPLRIKSTKPGMWADGGGLYLQCTTGPNDTVRKSWLFRFERNGRERQMGLGSLTTVPVQEAREKAAECRRLLQSGVDRMTNDELRQLLQEMYNQLWVANHEFVEINRWKGSIRACPRSREIYSRRWFASGAGQPLFAHRKSV